jgi:hypothetical protein
MRRFAIFVSRLGWGGRSSVGYTRPRYLGHLVALDTSRARAHARQLLAIQVRSCDRVVTRHDGSRRQRYGVRGAGLPGQVGLV